MKLKLPLYMTYSVFCPINLNQTSGCLQWKKKREVIPVHPLHRCISWHVTILLHAGACSFTSGSHQAKTRINPQLQVRDVLSSKHVLLRRDIALTVKSKTVSLFVHSSTGCHDSQHLGWLMSTNFPQVLVCRFTLKERLDYFKHLCRNLPVAGYDLCLRIKETWKNRNVWNYGPIRQESRILNFLN